MDLPLLLVVILAVGSIATMATVMANSHLRTRLIGENPLVNGLVPVAAAGVVFATTAVMPVLQDQIVDSDAPGTNLTAFVESITFGIPPIPDDYKLRALRDDEITTLLAPVRSPQMTIRLSPDEAERLNAISSKSGQSAQSPVSELRTYSMNEVVDNFLPAFAYYFEYGEWSKLCRDWATELGGPHGSSAQELEQFMASHVKSVANAAGLLAAMVGMLDRGDFSIPEIPGDGIRTTVPGYGFRKIGNEYVLLLHGVDAVLVSSDDSAERIAAATALAGLFQHAKTHALAQMFAASSTVLEREDGLMGKYLAEWQAILASRKPRRIELNLTISNIGKYDTFVRRDVKAAVGTRGSDARIEAVLHRVTDSTDDKLEPYESIKSRTAETHTYSADLDSVSSDQLRGAYDSGLNYLRVAVLASAGTREITVASQLTPFSRKAMEIASRRVNDIHVKL